MGTPIRSCRSAALSEPPGQRDVERAGEHAAGRAERLDTGGTAGAPHPGEPKRNEFSELCANARGRSQLVFRVGTEPCRLVPERADHRLHPAGTAREDLYPSRMPAGPAILEEVAGGCATHFSEEPGQPDLRSEIAAREARREILRHSG